MIHFVIDELKTQARITLKAFNEKPISQQLQSWMLKKYYQQIPERWQLKDCLNLVAIWHGFNSWKEVVDAFTPLERMTGEKSSELSPKAAQLKDQGEFWMRPGCPSFLNHWFVNLEEAKSHRRANGGFIVGFKKQFVIVESDYIEVLGTDSDSHLWKSIEYDAVTNVNTPECLTLAAQVARKFSITEYL